MGSGETQHPHTYVRTHGHTHALAHTRAHTGARAHAAYALHVLLCWFFFFFWSLFISWGHAPPARTLLVAHRSTPAHAPKGNTCTDCPPLSPTPTPTPTPNPKPQPPCEAFTGFKVFSRRAAPRIQVISPPSWLIALVSNHHPHPPTPLHPHRVAPQQGWEGQKGRERRGTGQTCSPPARQIYFRVPCI